MEEDSFGPSLPPLHEAIARILKDYPDGQIFKEIIQNADDAKASEVKFFIDCRSLPTVPSCLLDKDKSNLSDLFQGPALMSYNNATFTDQDWISIQQIQRSQKAQDPCKVGKFGVGFNSVYHLTDLPVILSKKYCGYFEPQLQLWANRPGKRHTIEWLHTNYPSALDPYRCIKGFSNSFLDGTLFRFPLRKIPSKLSDKTFTLDKVMELLKVFKNEADYLLLFLRSVCSIEVIQISQNGDFDSMFKVSISPDNIKAHKVRQKLLLKAVEENKIAKIKECIKIAIKSFDKENESTKTWLVVSRVGCDDEAVLTLADSLKTLPWVGTAVQIDSPDEDWAESSGRLYCSLPLPIEERAPFVVSVNGTFAVASNRRSINWPSQERRDNDCEWNKLLVEKCFPDCYVELIQELMTKGLVSHELVYKCWPIVSSEQNPWKAMLLPLYSQLLGSCGPVVYTHASSGQWISLADAVFVPPQMVNNATVKDMLLSVGTMLVELPPEQRNVIETYSTNKKLLLNNSLTPQKTRVIMQNNHIAYISLPPEQKLKILSYILSDGNYKGLIDLELIPLINGKFKKFEEKSIKEGDTNIYVCSKDFHHRILPGLDHMLVHVDDAAVNSLLLDVCRSGITQLVQLDVQAIVKLIRNILDTSKWTFREIENFWKWFQSTCTDDAHIEVFHDLPIVPTIDLNGMLIIERLSKTNSNVVYVPPLTTLPSHLKKSLEQLGIRFVCASEFPFVMHPKLSSFLYFFIPEDVINALPSHTDTYYRFPLETCSMLQTFFSSMSTDLVTSTRINKLCQLCIYTVLRDSNVHSIELLPKEGDSVKVQQNEFYCDSSLLPNIIPLVFKCKQPLLSFLLTCTAAASYFEVIDEVDYLVKIVFPTIEHSCLSSMTNYVTKFMFSVLDNLDKYIKQFPHSYERLFRGISVLPFVSVACDEIDEYFAPSSLYNPKEEILLQLFEPCVFPCREFTKYLDQLDRCGLKGADSVSADELNSILNKVTPLSGDGWKASIIEVKATTFTSIRALFSFIERCPNILNSRVSSSNQLFLKVLTHRVQTEPILPIITRAPAHYPSQLHWKGSSHPNSLTVYDCSRVIITPNDIKSYVDPIIIGSEALYVTGIPKALCDSLCVGKSLNDNLSDRVIQHLEHVIGKHTILGHQKCQTIAFNTYRFLSSCTTMKLPKLQSVDKWVWFDNNSTFVAPRTCAMKGMSHFSHSGSLEPCIHILPGSMIPFEDFLCANGVQKTLTNTQVISVLEMIEKGDIGLTSGEAWSLIESIFKWIVACHVKDLPGMLVPIRCTGKYPKLHPASKEVSYTSSEVLREIAEDSDSNIKFIHSSLEGMAAQLVDLGVLTPLSQKMDISEEIFNKDVGQHESLTNKLRNILTEYKDGVTIIKELVQNADDAGASEVNIVYDNRQHSTEKLLYKGMEGAHGPALVVHNNAIFTEEDFENITKLSGGTKKDKTMKIGKFGEGFCSVYHMTDIPSFVSGEWMYVFDPTLTYLKDEVKNIYQPGKRLKFTSKLVSKLTQMDPYENFFGFKVSEKYKETLFRFPLRSRSSEICSTIYNEDTIKELISNLKKVGEQLLLFLNNVKTITFRSITSVNSSAELNLRLERSECDLVKNLTKITVQPDTEDHKYWLISTVKETDGVKGQPEVASVACRLTKKVSEEQYEVSPLREGLLFCFLPLSVPRTGLPVHVHANFAVMRNRSGIWTSTTSDSPSDDQREQWNQHLMQTVVPQAYCHLLISLRNLFTSNTLVDDYEFYSLFPLSSELSFKYPWTTMIEHVYEIILSHELFYCKVLKEWLIPKECLFMSEGVLSVIPSKPTPKYVFYCIEVMKLPVISLPLEYIEHLGEVTMLNQKLFCEKFMSKIRLFSDCFILRNTVLLHMIVTAVKLSIENEPQSEEFSKILLSNPCIPCRPDGHILKNINQLLNPDTPLMSNLFDANSSHFPVHFFSEHKQVNQFMVENGLLQETLPWHLVIESAKSVQKLYIDNETQQANNRVKSLIKVIDNNIGENEDSDVPRELSSIEFLPVAGKPNGFILPWKGSSHVTVSPSNALYPSDKFRDMLLGTSKLLIAVFEFSRCDPFIPSSVCKKLGISSRVKCDEVLSSYCNLVKEFGKQDIIGEAECECIGKISDSVYSFLNNELEKDEGKTIELLCKYKTHLAIWNGNEFISPDRISRNWSLNGPYLYEVPSNLTNKTMLMKSLKIKRKFSIKTLFDTLTKLYEKHASKTLPTTLHKLVDGIVNDINQHKAENLKRHVTTLLPSDDYRIFLASKLSLNDTQWLEIEQPNDYNMVHSELNRVRALKLGVQPIRSRMLNEYSAEAEEFAGIPFGQNEKVTQRIKNILSQYPFGIAVLKELLQNADDAHASKIYVILDKRTHGTKKLPSDQWKDLQGPALLVWNDQSFTDADLKGIQNLGLGAKRENAESIGQFGIGFNVVYHLTDCPSFYTREDTLCVLDPHCRYIHGATQLSPGRCFKNINHRFWGQMSDLKSPFLLDCRPHGLPDDLKGGTLFRLPLRNIKELAEKSELVDWETSELITEEILEGHLNSWIDEMKETLLFLNHVLCLKYFVVDSNTSPCCVLRKGYEISLSQKACEQRLKYIETLKKCRMLAQTKSYPDAFHNVYPLSINTIGTGNVESEEQWLILLGFGDVDTSVSHQLISHHRGFLPKYGIAVPLGGACIQGKVFCFLPLPGDSGLPVHINGQFWLTSNRRSLWVGDNPQSDTKVQWNNMLISAIASSYVTLVTQLHTYIINQDGYLTEDELDRAIGMYYALFPYRETDETQPKVKDMIKECRLLSEWFFTKLVTRNCDVLLSKYYTVDGRHTVQWNLIENKTDPFLQLHFLSECNRKSQKQMMDIIQMRISNAPDIFHSHLLKTLESQVSPVTVCQATVYKFYTKFQDRIFGGISPLHVTNTPFQSVENFEKFINYLTVTESTCHVFRLEPQSSDLILLSADDVIRPFRPLLLHSKFYSLFPKSSSLFLHPSLFKLSRSYFSKSISFNSIKSLMADYFSQDLLLASEVEQSEIKTKSVKSLQSLWSCFNDEGSIFSNHRSQWVETWPVIPATNGYLYTSTSPLRPLYYDPISDHDKQKVFKVLKAINVPMLSLDIIDNAFVRSRNVCHSLSNHTDTIAYFALLHKRHNTFANLPNGWSDALVLLQYISHVISFIRYNQKSIKEIKSLPLFKTIDGHLTSLSGTNNVYMWPSPNLCKAGSHTWAASTIFLDPSSWKNSGFTESDFNIFGKKQDVFSVYNNLIFPVFTSLSPEERSLSPEERMLHLTSIRDHVYKNAEHTSKYSVVDRDGQTNAKLFKTNFASLECLESSQGTLLPISAFVDHNVKVFQVFSSHFNFLPDKFREEKWVKFFKKIKLQTELTFAEFITCCKEVETGHHVNTVQASTVLVDYLCSDEAKEWYKSNAKLEEIRDICFVVTSDLSELEWIQKKCQAPSIFPKLQIQLTRFKGAAILDCAPLVWTVRPIVTLPRISEAMIEYGVVDKLGIITDPSVEDVYDNIINISESKFSRFELFFKYDIQIPTNQYQNLAKVMSANISKLHNLESDKDGVEENKHLKLLKNVRCIPVPVHGGNSEQYVLVSSCEVVQMKSHSKEALIALHPYISFLESHLAEISVPLGIIGVNQSVTLQNIQYFLKKAYECFPEEFQVIMNPMYVSLLSAAIDMLHVLLNQQYSIDKDSKDTQLIPLYLPSVCGRLEDVSDLVFVDCKRYSKHIETFNFFEASYSLFKLPCKCVLAKYEKDFCLSLPKPVRPLGLSLVCRESAIDSVEPETAPNSQLYQHFLHLKSITKSMIEVLKKILHKESDKFSKHIDIDQFISTLDTFLNELIIIPAVNLHVGVSMGETRIASFKDHYVLQTSNIDVNSNDYACATLYIDSVATATGREIWKDISYSFCVHIARKASKKPTTFIPFTKYLSDCLKVTGSEELIDLLEEYEIDNTEVNLPNQKDDPPQVTLGSPIPKEWHQYLDKSMQNIFRTQDWVAYKTEEGSYVWAMVLYAVNSTEETGVSKRYQIITSEGDEVGFSVSILDLYRILTNMHDGWSQHDDESMNEEGTGSGSDDGINEVREGGELVGSRVNLEEKIHDELSDILRLEGDEFEKGLVRICEAYHSVNGGCDIIQRVVDELPTSDKNDNRASQVVANTIHRLQLKSSSVESAKRRRRQYPDQSAPHSSHSSSSGSSPSSDPPPLPPLPPVPVVKPDKIEAKRWFRQAESDYKAMLVLKQSLMEGHTVSCQAMFMAHEVIEKGLKAALYLTAGVGEFFLKKHNLLPIANAVNSEIRNINTETTSVIRLLPDCAPLVQIARELEPYYLETRFPNCYPCPTAPVDEFQTTQAQNIITLAEKGFRIIEDIISKK